MGVSKFDQVEVDSFGSKTNSLMRLKRAATRAAAYNPEDFPADTTDITLTMETAADAALTRIYTAVSGGTALTSVTLDKVFRFTGGRYTVEPVSGSNRVAFPVASVAPALGGLQNNLPATPSYQAWGWELETVTDAPKLQLRIAGNAVRGVRVRVDGKYVSKAALAYAATSSSNFLTLVFATRKLRTIVIEGTGNDLIQHAAVAPTAALSPGTGATDRVLAIVTGDSYSEGTGATYPGLFGYPKVLGRLLGWSDVRTTAVGSTGYLSTSNGTRKKVRDQIADWPVVNSDISMSDVDVVVLAAGYNDYAQANVLTLLQDEVAATIRTARNMCPNAIIFVLGSHSGARGPDAQTLAVEALIQQAFQQVGDSRSYYVPNASNVTPFTFGTGYVGATNASGDSDFKISADGTHPNDLGHQSIAQRLAAVIRNILAQL